ncbi:MAG TPA: SH3 domain-containing protein [Longimicrobium sp.]|jgi:hypothetical protein
MRIAGRIREGRLWEVSENGSHGAPVGVVRAVLARDGVLLRAQPRATASTLQVLGREVILQVRQLRAGWFEVTLLDGTRGWVRASEVSPFVIPLNGLAEEEIDEEMERAYASEEETEATRDEEGEVEFTTGAVLPVRTVSISGSIAVLELANGQRVISNASLIRRIRRPEPNLSVVDPNQP